MLCCSGPDLREGCILVGGWEMGRNNGPKSGRRVAGRRVAEKLARVVLPELGVGRNRRQRHDVAQRSRMARSEARRALPTLDPVIRLCNAK